MLKSTWKQAIVNSNFVAQLQEGEPGADGNINFTLSSYTERLPVSELQKLNGDVLMQK